MPKSNFDDVIKSGVVVLRSLLSFLLRTLQLGWKIVASNLRIFRSYFGHFYDIGQMFIVVDGQKVNK